MVKLILSSFQNVFTFKLRQVAIYTLIAVLIAICCSCRQDFEYGPSLGNLEFSKDTVFLDTVFTGISSKTYTLKVYNRSNNDIAIPNIRLRNGQDSNYRLNVDGEAGNEFENIPVFAKDSIFIFIEGTFSVPGNVQDAYLNVDAIQFDYGDLLQEVHLVSLVKDAIFLYPKKRADGSQDRIILGTDGNGDPISVPGFLLEDDELRLTNSKPYVVYGYAAVSEGKQLVVDAGARVYFHNSSGLYVQSGGTLLVEGKLSEDQDTLENEVIFEGDRLGTEYADLPGQWGTIWFEEGSVNNQIEYLTIKNATVGITLNGDGLLEAPTLTLRNTQIYNSASINLWARTAFVDAANLVLGGAGNNALFCDQGGKYAFVHCTIANFWQQGFRSGTAVKLANFSSAGGWDLNASFSNCIIDGNTFYELNLEASEGNAMHYLFKDCMIKFNDGTGRYSDDPKYDFGNTALFDGVQLNAEAGFQEAKQNDFRLVKPSAAQDKAGFEAANEVPLDLLGKDRTGSPDIGAYEVPADN